MKHDILRRYAYIETSLYWGNGLTASHLGEVFGIARQNAQKVISDYRELYPDNLTYDASKKCHVLGDEFKPAYISLNTGKYLDYIGGVSSVEHYWGEIGWNADIPFESDSNYLKPPQHQAIVKSVLSAIREKRAIHVVYRAKPEVLAMSISPHHLVYANYRYHVRAYNHAKDWFADFVLTRFIEVDESEEGWVSEGNDPRWNNWQELRFEINPELPVEAQQALQADYSLGTSTLRMIKVRQAMLGYICREMERVDWNYGVRLWLDVDKKCYQRKKFHS